MNFDLVIECIKKGYSYIEIAEKLNLPVTTLKSRCIKQGIYFKNIKTNKTEKCCPHCKIYKPFSEFYISKGKMIYCKICTTNLCIDRKRKFKELCLTYKGNCCAKCGYNKCNRALHFHHLDPKQKSFAISKYKSFILSEKVTQELDKCILVCANCHAELHS